MKIVAAVVAVLCFAWTTTAATTLEVVIPNTSETGVAFNFTVTARNGAAIDTSYTGTVHFTSSEGTATLPADYTFTLADSGTHTFSATMNTAGSGYFTANHTITATDTITASITGTDVTTVRWNDDLVRRFFIQVPQVVDRDVPFPIEVRALNASGFVITNYTGTIHFTANRNEILPADYTFTLSDAGVHSFMVTATLGNYSSFSVVDINQFGVSGTSGQIDVVCPELVATATNSGPMCSGGSAILFGSANLPVIDYWWVSSVGHPPVYESHQQNPIVVSPYTYILTVRQANDCTAKAQTTVTIHQPEVAQISLSTTSLCGPGNITATLTNASSFSNIVWSAIGGTIVSGQGTPSVEVMPNPNATSVTIDIDLDETSSGCSSYGPYINIPVGSEISAEISTVTASCALTEQSASVADAGSGATYAWSITNGAITSGQGTRTIEYVANGTGSATLSANVTNGSCSASDDAVITVNGPTAVTGGELALCGTSEAQIPVTLSGTPPFRIVWSDGVVQDNIATFNTTRTVTGEGAYTLTQVSDAQCNGVASGTANVSLSEAPSITDEPDNAHIRSGQTATLSVGAEGAGLLYVWYEGHAGDRSRRASVEVDPVFTTRPLTSTTHFWVEVLNNCGTDASQTAVVAIESGKRRAARH